MQNGGRCQIFQETYSGLSSGDVGKSQIPNLHSMWVIMKEETRNDDDDGGRVVFVCGLYNDAFSVVQTSV